jgi:hypothetical protein
MERLYELLLFPDRAENLGQFTAYDVDLGHWRQLSAVFRRAFRTVYERGTSAILLVHGAQGTGKTLFSLRLEQDFGAAAAAVSRGGLEPTSDNLWHSLVGEAASTTGRPARMTARRASERRAWCHAADRLGHRASTRASVDSSRRTATWNVGTETTGGAMVSARLRVLIARLHAGRRRS